MKFLGKVGNGPMNNRFWW